MLKTNAIERSVLYNNHDVFQLWLHLQANNANFYWPFQATVALFQHQTLLENEDTVYAFLRRPDVTNRYSWLSYRLSRQQTSQKKC